MDMRLRQNATIKRTLQVRVLIRYWEFAPVHVPDCRADRYYSLKDGESLSHVSAVGDVAHDALHDAHVSIQHPGDTSAILEHCR